MEDFVIFVSSSDNYSDIWDVFFDMFRKYWPEYKGKIYLQTQEKTYSHEGLNIICTHVGRRKYFGETLRAGLDSFPEDNILLFMIDYMIMDKVNNNCMCNYYRYFKSEDLDSLCLVSQRFTNAIPAHNGQFLRANPPKKNLCNLFKSDRILFGYQLAFWKKRVLKEMALPHENPWMSEWYGSARAEIMRLQIECLKAGENPPVKYDARGCLHQGTWLNNAVQFMKSQNYSFDFSKRGYYCDHEIYESLSFRIKLKFMIWSTGFCGSYWDLIRRYINGLENNKEKTNERKD